MTIVYKPLGLDEAELCQPVDDEGSDTIDAFVNGRPGKAAWKPVRMQLFLDDGLGRKLRPCDSPWLGSWALMFRRSAVDALGPMLEEHGELLPLDCPGAELYLYNPWLLDAFDEAASTVERFDDGRIMAINRHVFRPGVLGDVPAFKIPNLRISPTYVTQRFVDRWNEAGLYGLEFPPVWTPN